MRFPFLTASMEIFMRTSVTHEIAAALEKEILDGQFLPGDLFSTEHTLCARFGVSRTPIREVLRRLEPKFCKKLT